MAISYYWHSYRAFTHPHTVWVQLFGFASVCMCCTWIASPSSTGLGSVNTASASDPLLPETAEMLSWGSSTSCWFSSFPGSPSMLPQNGSKRFWWTTLNLPPPVTRAILKTSNPLYGCPSTHYTVSSQWSWILCLPLKAVLLRRTWSPTLNWVHLILWTQFCLCLWFSFSVTCWATL